MGTVDMVSIGNHEMAGASCARFVESFRLMPSNDSHKGNNRNSRGQHCHSVPLPHQAPRKHVTLLRALPMSS